jgi:hypothetical protein
MPMDSGGPTIPRRHERKGLPAPAVALRAEDDEGARSRRRTRKAGERQQRYRSQGRSGGAVVLLAVLAWLVLVGLQTADAATRNLLGLPPRRPALVRVAKREGPPYFTVELFGRGWPQ